MLGARRRSPAEGSQRDALGFERQDGPARLVREEMQVGREDVLADQVGLDEGLRGQAQENGVEIVEAGDVLVERRQGHIASPAPLTSWRRSRSPATRSPYPSW